MLDSKDGGCTRKQGAAGAVDAQLTQARHTVAIGPSCTDSTESSNYVYSANKVVQLSPTAVGSFLGDRTNFPHLVGLRPVDEETGFAALFHTFADLALGVVRRLNTVLKQSKGKSIRIVADGALLTPSREEFSKAIKLFKDKDARVILLALSGVGGWVDALNYFCHAYDEGFFGDDLLYVTVQWTTASWITTYAQDPTAWCKAETVFKAIRNAMSVTSPFLRDRTDTTTTLVSTRTPAQVWADLWGGVLSICTPLNVCSIVDPLDAWMIGGGAYDAVWAAAIAINAYLTSAQATTDGVTSASDLTTTDTTLQQKIYDHIWAELLKVDFEGVTGRVRYNSDGTRISDFVVGYYDPAQNYRVVPVGTISRTAFKTDFSIAIPLKSNPIKQALDLCEAGYERTTDGGCQACVAGYYNNVTGGTCTACPKGAISVAANSTFCTNCTGGFYSPIEGGTECLACSIGYYRNDSVSRDTCERCPVGHYANVTGLTDCIACPATKTTSGLASVKESDCTCPEEFFLNQQNNTCQLCLNDAMECTGGDGVPNIRPGFWASATSSSGFAGPEMVKRCYAEPKACKGGGIARETSENDFVAARRRLQDGNVLTIDPICTSPRFGPMCSLCPEGFQKSADGSCTECHSNFQGYVLFVLFTILIALIVACYYAVNHLNSARTNATTQLTVSVSLLLNYLQDLAIVEKLQVNLIDGVLKNVLGSFSFFSFNFEDAGRECFLPGASGFEVYIFAVSIPFQMIAITYTIWLFSVLLNKYVWSALPAWTINKTINALGFLFTTLYVTVCTFALTPYMCIYHPKAEPTLQSFPSVVCGSDEHRRMEVLGGFASAIYIAGFVSFLLVLSIYAPKWNAECPGFEERYFFLIGDCHPRVWWWQTLNLVKNLLVSLVPVMTPQHGRGQLVCMLLVFDVFLLLEIYFFPWKDTVNNWLDISASVAMITLLFTLMGWAEYTKEGEDLVHAFTLTFMGAHVLASCVAIGFGAERCRGRALRREKHSRIKLRDRMVQVVKSLHSQAWGDGFAMEKGRDWLMTLLACPDADLESINRFLEICETELLEAPHPSLLTFGKHERRSMFGVMVDTFGLSQRQVASTRRLKLAVGEGTKNLARRQSVNGVVPTVVVTGQAAREEGKKESRERLEYEEEEEEEEAEGAENREDDEEYEGEGEGQEEDDFDEEEVEAEAPGDSELEAPRYGRGEDGGGANDMDMGETESCNFEIAEEDEGQAGLHVRRIDMGGRNP
uniref:Tyrosine-protein kinase ephrin type A/B receptor-like domain-containing protein n=1 Tax=Chromera velia CCMP2878 TaxID=1169474 RepID=A0A0G4I570_9ALVE|eukprot:Cvel_11110.t1-p1 / transcript=Cvel_11110.t1 / gene=Cvel_11110 / organism=Chromera_velia_CCMP2878 / gene_product=Multiple epidermal growth factor-like domains, putative / transcript_product=Multiple epidermal growth factor-like domains, putative / location=Cvel_scaffold687:52497-59702(-) / protein_length=1242 / sequence_SO=supercontig / SO=protein_coding / is_pseudo=false